MFYVQRERVSGGRPLTTKEGIPVVIEVRENGGYFNRPRRDLSETDVLPECRKGLLATNLESTAFIEISGARIKGYHRIPKMKHQFHPTRVIP